MIARVINAALMLLVLTVLTGLIYPLVFTGLAQLLFPHQANGSLVYKNGQPVGSLLIGQSFTSPRYFHGRPSEAGEGYNAAASSGSNLGPTNKELIDKVARRAQKVRDINGLPPDAPVPSDLVTASGSGLDPHISVAAAYLQVPRVAKARRLPEQKVKELVDRNIISRQFGILGEPRVNVLQLNIELDQLTPQR